MYHELKTNSNIELKPANLIARFADSRCATVLGTVDLVITFHGRTIKVNFRVLPKLETELLFGLDILTAVDYRFKFSPIAEIKEKPITNSEEIEASLKVITEELKLFAKINKPTTYGEHVIRLKPNTKPVNIHYIPRNPVMLEVMYKEADAMIEADVIEPADGEWCSPVVITKRKNKSYRVCNDFRKVNEVSFRDVYPIPHINATLDRLRNSKYFSKIDLRNGYWNIPLAKESRPITAFVIPGRGLFQYKVMPFGLHSASATFQRTVEKVLGPELGVSAFVYLDDVVILGKTVSEHLKNVRRVLKRLHKANLKVNPEKSEFFKTQITYLGHVVDSEGIHTDPEKIKAILEFKKPENVTELRRFIGIISWYRRFIPDCSALSKPLSILLQKKQKWNWTTERNNAFETLKTQLSTAPVLAVPDFSLPFCLQTDASKYGLGAVLTQSANEREVVIAYASRTLNKAEQNYSVTEKECLAVVWGISKMRYYLEGYSFTVITDHLSLKWLQSIQSPTGRIARWSIYLQQFDFVVKYRKGKLNKVADALSRYPLPNENEDNDEDLDETIFIIGDHEQCQWYKNLLQATLTNPDRYPEFTVRDGILFRHMHHSLNFTDREKTWKLCVPQPLREKVLLENHDAPTAGHLGIAKTIARISENYYWPGMNGDIASYVRQCVSCQRYKSSQNTVAGKMGTCNATQPWEYVAMDIIGPLVRSSKGHKYLLVMQDKFTKWVEFCPLREQKTRPIIQAFKEKILLRYGTPRILITDNGTQFTAKDFQKLVESFGITHQRTSPYSPQCNPVERTNKTIKTIIAQYVGENQRKWDNLLPEFQFAINSAKHESTKFSPAYLNFQREILPPNTLRSDVEKNVPMENRHVEKLQDTMKLVRVNLARAFTSQSKNYDKKRRDWLPATGDKVIKREHHLSSAIDNFSAKLAPRYSDKYVISKIVSRTVLELKDRLGNISRAHVKDVKPFQDTEESDTGEKDANLSSIQTVQSRKPRRPITSIDAKLDHAISCIREKYPCITSVNHRPSFQEVLTMDVQSSDIRDVSENEEEVIRQINSILEPKIPIGPAVIPVKCKGRGTWMATINNIVEIPTKKKCSALNKKIPDASVKKMNAIVTASEPSVDDETTTALLNLANVLTAMPTWKTRDETQPSFSVEANAESSNVNGTNDKTILVSTPVQTEFLNQSKSERDWESVYEEFDRKLAKSMQCYAEAYDPKELLEETPSAYVPRPVNVLEPIVPEQLTINPNKLPKVIPTERRHESYEKSQSRQSTSTPHPHVRSTPMQKRKNS